MGLKDRLERLEASKGPQLSASEVYSSPHYAELRRQTEQEIEEDLAAGRQPFWYIDEGGIIRAAGSGCPMRGLGDIIRELDQAIAQLDREIEEEEERLAGPGGAF